MFKFKDTIRDKLLPIVISVNYSYIERENKGNSLEPASDLTLSQSFETEVIFFFKFYLNYLFSLSLKKIVVKTIYVYQILKFM